MLSNHQKISIALLLGFLLSGCALREVRFRVTEPSRIQLPGIDKIAIIEFSGQNGSGLIFANRLVKEFQTRDNYTIIPPAETSQGLNQLQVAPSRFQEAGVVAEAGHRLGADALLMGDVRQMQVYRNEQLETVQRKVGERREIIKEKTPDGKEQELVQCYPVYQDFWIKHIQRTAEIYAEARLVKVSDNSVLWQNKVQMARTVTAEEKAEGERKGDWSSDEELLRKTLSRASRTLLADLLPVALKRVRNLAEPETSDEYTLNLRLGNQQALNRHWDEAKTFWFKAQALAPDRPEAKANLGIYEEKSGDYEQALKDYEFAARILGEPWKTYADEVGQMRKNADNPK